MSEKCTAEGERACPVLAKAEILDSRLEELESKNGDSHREIFRRLNELERESAVINERYVTIISKLDALSEKVQALESRPGRRWEGIVDKALWAVCAAAIAFLLARVGL